MFNIKHQILNILIKTKLQNYLLKRYIIRNKISGLEELVSVIKSVLDDNLIENIRRLYPTIEINDNMKMNKILKLIK